MKYNNTFIIASRAYFQHHAPTQTNKNLATNTIKGLSIPSRSLTRARSDIDNNKINIFGFFVIKSKSKYCKINGARNS